METFWRTLVYWEEFDIWLHTHTHTRMHTHTHFGISCILSSRKVSLLLLHSLWSSGYVRCDSFTQVPKICKNPGCVSTCQRQKQPKILGYQKELQLKADNLPISVVSGIGRWSLSMLHTLNEQTSQLHSNGRFIIPGLDHRRVSPDQALL